MNQQDNCTMCGFTKAVFVTTTDGNTNVLLPGNSAYVPRDIVERWECACSGCGLLYSLNSLASPVEMYE